MGKRSALAIWEQVKRDAEQRDALICHVVIVSDRPRRIDCVDGCGGPEPHVHEYRASDIRPSTADTIKMQDHAR